MHFVASVMEMLLLLLRNSEDDSPAGMYFVLSIDNCKRGMFLSMPLPAECAEAKQG
jgi:hypothetical protein